ncbi:ABC transporter ATP-binding protein [Elioraea sp.]|uniref:ABC transporter ATP-binding protein n=1 Tax=Elioraea sp. TaxID=2185103 RepID=UPI003F719206
MTAPLLEATRLVKHFPLPRHGLSRRGAVRAVEEVDLAVLPGEVLGLVGESGSGKSTLGRLVLRLIDPTAGRIVFEGQDITALSRGALRPLRRRMQMVFQDPYASLNPRRPVGEAIAEVLRLHGLAGHDGGTVRARELLAHVGLSGDDYPRLPRSFSGGQRQRIAIARALAVEPKLLVADEPVSALDVSVQAGILTLLRQLRAEFGLAMLFISHDLSVVEAMADRVMVLYLGRVMEVGPVRAIFTAPRHPYTAALLSAAPGRALAHRMPPLAGEIPSPADPPSGCVFRTRCPFALPACAETVPQLRAIAPGHSKACIRDDLSL